MERYDEALADFNQAIEVDPENTSALANRGVTYRMVGRHEAALADFNRAIELAPEEDWYLYNRASVRKILGQRHEASTDLENALQLAQQHYEQDLPDLEKWRITFNMALYRLAADEMEAAETLYQRTLSGRPSPHFIRSAIGDVNEFLAVFPNHTQARAMRDLLQRSLTNTRDPR